LGLRRGASGEAHAMTEREDYEQPADELDDEAGRLERETG
jgi:hypothetical protein